MKKALSIDIKSIKMNKSKLIVILIITFLLSCSQEDEEVTPNLPNSKFTGEYDVSMTCRLNFTSGSGSGDMLVTISPYGSDGDSVEVHNIAATNRSVFGVVSNDSIILVNQEYWADTFLNGHCILTDDKISIFFTSNFGHICDGEGEKKL